MSINKRIRETRQAIGLTQTKFAERIAISISYLAGMELGNKKVNERTVRLISTEFNVNEHWLRTGEGSVFSEGADAKIAKISSLFKSLNPHFQDCALNQLNELAELNNMYKNKD